MHFYIFISISNITFEMKSIVMSDLKLLFIIYLFFKLGTMVSFSIKLKYSDKNFFLGHFKTFIFCEV